MTNPSLVASEIARMLDSDPVMARQVREYVAPERLRDLLDIEPPPAEVPDDNSPDAADALATVLDAFTLPQVVEAYAQHRK